MFILDPNVLSNAMAAQPAPAVAAWMAGQPPELLFTAWICQAEILSGIAILPEGRRRASLEAAADAMFRDDFAGRVLPFDGGSDDSGEFARTKGASVVTRDLGDFEACGLTLIDPWRSA